MPEFEIRIPAAEIEEILRELELATARLERRAESGGQDGGCAPNVRRQARDERDVMRRLAALN